MDKNSPSICCWGLYGLFFDAGDGQAWGSYSGYVNDYDLITFFIIILHLNVTNFYCNYMT